jgi:hypothetical protein
MRRNRVISCRRPRQSKTNKLILKLKDLVILIRYVKVHSKVTRQNLR